MKFVARCAMALTALMFLLAVVVVLVASVIGEHSLLWEMVELPPTLPRPAPWAMALTCLVMSATLGALMVAFWSVHKILREEGWGGFARIAYLLRRCGRALMWFWLGLAVLLCAMPPILLSTLDLDEWPEVEWVPLDIEIVILVLAVALLAVSRELERAHEIEDENKQFL